MRFIIEPVLSGTGFFDFISTSAYVVGMDLADRITQATKPYLFQNSFILRDLPVRDLEVLEQNTESESKKRGEVLFRQGGYPKGVYWLISGKIKIYQGNAAGQRQTHYIYSDGDLIGHRQLIAEVEHPVSAALLENTVIRFIPGEVFRNLLSTSPFFTRNVLTGLAREFTVWVNRMTVFQHYPVRHKLILTLLMLYEQYRISGETPGLITITRTELSELVGASLETVVRILNKLKSANLIRISGRRITLLDPEGLLDLLNKQGKED